MDLQVNGSSKMVVNYSGNVGINTTNPTHRLSVCGNGGNCATPAYVSTSNAWTAGADYAEYFLTRNADLQAGETVCIDETKANAVKRCDRAHDSNVMGIVSTEPGFVGNRYGAVENNKNYVIVAMLGQIPAHASNENGAILIGDSLTSASKPGFVMKASAGDSTVGVALESLTGDTGIIQVMISRRNKSLTVEQVEQQVQQNIAAMEIQDEVNLLIKEATDQLNISKVINIENAGTGRPSLTIDGLGDSEFAGGLKVGGNTEIKGPLTITYGGETKIEGSLATSGEVKIGNNVGMGSIKSTAEGLVISADSSNNLGRVRGIVLDLDDNQGLSALTIKNQAQQTVSKIDSLGNFDLAGSFALGGDAALHGNLTLGDATSDLIDVKGSFTSSLNPNETDKYDIGSVTNRWSTGYFASVAVADLALTSNQITSTNDMALKAGNGNLVLQTSAANSSIILKPAGDNASLAVSGMDNIATLIAENGYLRVGLGSVAAKVAESGDLYVTGSTEVAQDLYVTGNIYSASLADSIKQQIKNSLPLEQAKVYQQEPSVLTISKQKAQQLSASLLQNGQMLLALATDNAGEYLLLDANQRQINSGTFSNNKVSHVTVVATSDGSAAIIYTNEHSGQAGEVTIINSEGQIIMPSKVFNSGATTALTALALSNNYLLIAYGDNGYLKYVVISGRGEVIKEETIITDAVVSEVSGVVVAGHVRLAYSQSNQPTKLLSMNVANYQISKESTMNASLSQIGWADQALIYQQDGVIRTALVDQNLNLSNIQDIANNGQNANIESGLAGSYFLTYQEGSDLYYRTLSVDQLSGAQKLSSELQNTQTLVNKLGTVMVLGSIADGIGAIIWPSAISLDTQSTKVTWSELAVNARTAGQMVLYSPAGKYSQPLNLSAGNNSIDLGFIRYTFVAHQGDNYISLIGYGFGAKEVRSVIDDQGRTYQAQRINAELYLIADLPADAVMIVEYTADINSRSLVVLDNIDSSRLSKLTTSVVSASPTKEQSVIKFATGHIATIFINDQDEAKFVVQNPEGHVVKSGSFADFAISSIASVTISDDQAMIALAQAGDNKLYTRTINYTGLLGVIRALPATGVIQGIATLGNSQIALLVGGSDLNLYYLQPSGELIGAKQTIGSMATGSITAFGNLVAVATVVNGQVQLGIYQSGQLVGSQVLGTNVQTVKLLANGNNLVVSYLSGGVVKYQILNWLGQETGIEQAALAGVNQYSFSSLATGELLLVAITGGQAQAQVMNNQGVAITGVAALGTASSVAASGDQVLINNNGLQLITILPFSLATGSTNIDNITFVYENYGQPVIDLAADRINESTFRTEGDNTIKLMSVRSLDMSEIQSWTSLDSANWTTYESQYCALPTGSTVASWPISSGECLFYALPEKGDVVVADPSQENMVVKSIRANSHSIVGVVTDQSENSNDQRLIATAGTILVKVSNENGLIKKGDLLTSATYPGLAMKATSKTAGIIGMAMADFDPIAICREQLVSVAKQQILASQPNVNEEQLQAQLKSLDLSSCQNTTIKFGLVKVLIQIDNPVVSADGQVVTVVDDAFALSELPVIDYEEMPNIVVKGEAIFSGDVVMQDAEFKGNILVAGDVTIRGNLEIAGAIVQEYWDGSAGQLKVGDAVYISGNDEVNIVYADSADFHPAIGIVAEIIPAGQLSAQQINARLQALGYTTDAPAPAEISAGLRLIKVATAGVVGGFRNLQAGATYYLNTLTPGASIIESVNEAQVLLEQAQQLTTAVNQQQVVVSDLLNEETRVVTEQRSFSIIPPSADGSVQQVMGVAKSDSEMLILTNVNYQINDNSSLPVIME